MRKFPERCKWNGVKDLMGNREVFMGRHLAYQFYNSPRRILHMMSYYKFAAKLIGTDKKVLDVGCGEGMGTWLLAVECGKAKGIDMDREAIEVGKRNWKDKKISFECMDFLTLKKEVYDAIVSFDVIEHILPENMPHFFAKISDYLSHNGMAIIGTPNITSDQYASPITKAGHVNLYSGDRLEEEMKKYFHHVFMFGANDEVVHTGFLPMSHYLIAIGCRKRRIQ
jgi:2-polyprenyl-3-methyl-5-hydroxy-6-metoxy-1,4-benzoquinol methylase